ncbi:MAG: putative Ig domain-containing protein, partial [bacterium]
SDFSGNYKFIGLSPGTYYVEVMDYQGEYYPAGYRAEGSIAEALDPIIILPSLSVDEINVALFPKASLSGKITDEHDLKPLGNIVVIAIPTGYNLRAIASPGEPAPYPGPYYQAETSYAMSAEPYATTYGPVMGTGGGTPYGPYGDYYQLQFALTDGDGRYTIKNLEEGDYRILALDPAFIYEGEYYKDFSPDQWEQATIIQIKRSVVHPGYNMKLHVGELYSEKDEYPYILLRDYYPAVDYISSSSGAWSWQGSGGFGGSSAAAYGSTGFPAQPGGPIGDSTSLEIISEAVDQAAVNRIYTYQVHVADIDPEISIKYALQKNPAGMTIDHESGLIQWQPTDEERGSTIVQVQVSAGSDMILLQSAFQSFRLTVVEDHTPPDEIEGLTATEGNTQITLSWAPSKDSAGDLADQVLYIDDGTGYGEGKGLGKTVATYTVTDLKNETTYTFKITARDDLGNESAGALVTATPQATARIQSTLNSTLLGNYWDNVSFKTFTFPLWYPQITSNWWELPAISLFHGHNSLRQQEGINSYWQ